MKTLLTTLFFILILESCAIPIHQSLRPELTHQIHSIKVVSIIPNEEINIQFDEKHYLSIGKGGLFWAFIDENKLNQMRRQAVLTQITPLLKTNTHFDFREHYWEALETTLAQSPWLKILHLDKSPVDYNRTKIAQLRLPLLLLKTSYALSPNCQVLIVQTKAQLYLTDLNKPDYLGINTYYSTPLVNEKSKTIEIAIKQWAANQASHYRSTLTEAIEQNMRMLQIDLLDNHFNLNQDEKIRLLIRTPISGWRFILEGQIIEQTKNRVLMREKKSDNLFSIGLLDSINYEISKI